MIIDGLKSDTAVAPTNEISQPTPSKSQWLKSLIDNTPKNLRKHFDEHSSKYLVVTIATLAVYLWNGYHSLDKQSAVSNAKIEFLEKKFTESEMAYKELMEKELKLAKCRNGVILECYNKCNLQEILKRQNTCEATK